MNLPLPELLPWPHSLDGEWLTCMVHCAPLSLPVLGVGAVRAVNPFNPIRGHS